MVNISVALQAGGLSSRMGRDKGLLPFGDIPLVEYIYDQVRVLGFDVFVVSNHPADYQFLRLPVYSDIISGVGALGGIHTILSYMPGEYVLALACDMPFINLALIGHMARICVDSDVVIPEAGRKNFLEPFRAIYSKQCLPLVEKAIENGKRRAISFLDDVRVARVTSEVVKGYDPEGISFLNLNTPDDYKLLLSIVAQRLGKQV